MLKTLRRAVALLSLFAILVPTATLAQATATAEVRGVLLDTGGLPAKGYQIGLKTSDGNLFLSKATPADGTFVIDGLPPATFQLVAFAPDGGEVPVVAKQMALAAGQKERVEIRLASDKALVAGRPPAEAAAAGASTASSTFSWKALGYAALAIVGGFAIGEWVINDDDDNDVERPASPSLPPSR
jgi:hypothetical protein